MAVDDVTGARRELNVAIQGGQGVQAGDYNSQENAYIGTYVQSQVVLVSTYRDPDRVVAGEVPQKAPAFQPRAELASCLSESGPGVTIIRAITGMRGVGKTQIAAAHARACINQGWRLVAWVNAESSSMMLNGLAEVASALKLVDPAADLESIGMSVRHWLEADGQQCLVVFDNATDLDELVQYIPAAGRCQVIITSNQLETAALGKALRVDVFNEQEAMTFLAERTGQTDIDGARELAAELGFLPLALAQAAAVIAAQHLDYQTYIARLRALPIQKYLKRTVGEPYPRGLAETIILALDTVVEVDETGLCKWLVDVISLLSTSGVPRSFLYAAGREAHFDEADTNIVFEPESIDDALGRLANSSLLTFSIDNSTVASHRLIMRIARECAAQDDNLSYLGTHVAGLLYVVNEPLSDEPWRDRPASRNVIQQVTALNDHLAPYLHSEDADTVEYLLDLRQWAATLLTQLNENFTYAIEYCESLVRDSQNIRGTTHRDTLQCITYLGLACLRSGRADEAITLLERGLADCEQTLGERDSLTLNFRNHLAIGYQTAGRLYQSLELMERTLADRERALGPDHPGTLSTRDNLALIYQSVGRLKEAIPLYERSLAAWERTWGEDHPDTLICRNSLAMCYATAGRVNEAVILLERTLADRERILGPEHPDTLRSRNNLAFAYSKAGRMEETISLTERTLADYERILGPDHPDTLMSWNNLACSYDAVGRLEDAIPLHERTLASMKRLHGLLHPNTLKSCGNLARDYHRAGRLDDAIALYKRTIAEGEHVLGTDHPDILELRYNLASAYRDAANPDSS
jgi:tetratricopeptide (TPR) repeat protein